MNAQQPSLTFEFSSPAGAQVIVLERRPRWILRLAAVGPAHVRFRSCRSVEECSKLLVEQPESVVAIQVDDNARRVLTYLCGVTVSFPQCLTVALLERGHQQWEVAMREAGALLCLQPTTDLRAWSELVRRYAALHPAPQSFPQQILANLPLE